ncbi:hypothetical protein COO59_18290 [Mixta theicola]|uniref:Uncharacterized protein n=1 Tax=Mixta theicola TaxID=1458355 RepID=A0A2K1Q5H2_9GAMM|nr:hypothetical protein COO59_18290 [Mixta theicola]
MIIRRVPTGFRILLGVGIFLLTFLLARPSSPVTAGEREFWIKAASFFGEHDVEGFVGISLLLGCTSVTIIGYQITVRLIERKLNKSK